MVADRDQPITQFTTAKTKKNKAENVDFQSYAVGRGYITIAMLVLSNANAKQC